MDSGRKYVSRGGLKLEHALQAFAINPSGKICLDAGASTGGFTDCLLQHGAEKVYAVDVAYGQFDWKLRNDPRVVVIERQNIRYLSALQVPDKVTLVCLDLAFISLKKIFPVLVPFLSPEAVLIALIKPQFEVAKSEVGEKGVVKDPVLHDRVVKEIREAGEHQGWKCLGITPSPLLGPEGNREFLILFLVPELL
ncbi:MAG: TlyA family RNA methyltransferase [Deltaproteobacteria bacterium]|nr:TlyA family RNA methyltransferase [Deltaproteobacteria bacterium]